MRQLIGPRTLVRRRLTALQRQLPLALDGQPEGVHQARVASRRLRELLPVLGALPRDPHVRKLRREIRSLTRGLGPIRELDVALASLARLADGAPARAGALAAVSARLTKEYRQAASDLARLRDVDIRRLSDRVSALVPVRPTPAAVRRCAARVAERIGSRGRAARQAVDACGTLFSAGQLHAARIALKKFRYALEIGEQAGRFRLKATMRRLKEVQDHLGHLHDLHVLASRIRDCECADAARHDDLEQIALDIDEEMRRLHCAFLADRHRLHLVFTTARRVCLQLGVLPVRMSQAPARTSDGLRRAAG